MVEGCAFGRVSREKVDNMEKAVEEIRASVANLSNHYSQRLPAWATVVISILAGLLGVVAGIAFS